MPSPVPVSAYASAVIASLDAGRDPAADLLAGDLAPLYALPSLAVLVAQSLDAITPDEWARLYPDVHPQRARQLEAVCIAVEYGATLRDALRTPDAIGNGDTDALSWSTFNTWMGRSPSADKRYVRARSISADTFADEATDVARRGARRFIDHDKLGVQAARLAYDAARWRASVANPKRYGDRVDVTSDGERLAGVVALPPERVPIDVVDLEEGDGYSIEP